MIMLINMITAKYPVKPAAAPTIAPRARRGSTPNQPATTVSSAHIIPIGRCTGSRNDAAAVVQPTSTPARRARDSPTGGSPSAAPARCTGSVMAGNLDRLHDHGPLPGPGCG